MKTNIIFLVILQISISILSAAAVIDGELIINVLINECQDMNFELSGKASFFEDNSPFINELTGVVNVCIAEEDTTEYWTICDTVKLRHVTWKDFTLTCHHYADSLVFADKSDAIAHALLNDIDISRIESKSNNSLIVKISDGIKDILGQLPININTDDTLKIGDNKYTGKFKLYSNNGNLQLVNIVEIEEYLKSVVAYEIGSNSPMEALKAQAVASRSMTLIKLLATKHPEPYIDLCATTHCQVYGGLSRRNSFVNKAVDDTRHEILCRTEYVADAVFASCCGGRTEDSDFIWSGGKRDYLMSSSDTQNGSVPELTTNNAAVKWIISDRNVNCSPNEESFSWEHRAYKWSVDVELSYIEQKTGLTNVSRIEPVTRGKSGRISLLRITSSEGVTEIKGEYRIRSLFPGAKSTLLMLNIDRPKKIVHVTGKGSGHGVGMCQVGALNLARKGWKYNRILEKYFPGTLINKHWKLVE